MPSIGGISHSPEERTEDSDIVNGANVLLRTLLALDERGLDGQVMPERARRFRISAVLAYTDIYW